MIENLVIVESPAKAKTIEKFLGEGFTVKSSFGHIRDLSKKNLGIDIENGFEPHYTISEDKKKVVSELKTVAKRASTIWLASDEDREGEAIAWHLKEALELSESNTKRIVFNEITKDAIEHAISNPRKIETNLVMAQQARRVLDRLVGFELSPVLWKKVRPKLSAGRVQSAALRLVVEREREVLAFEAKSQYRVVAQFIPNGESQESMVEAELDCKFETEEEAIALLERCKGASFKIEEIEEREGSRTPPPPFTTSTLQQEASRKLGFSLNQTMRYAQSLYEAGHITYMRTDSLNLSKLSLAAAKGAITELYGANYSKVRNFKTKTKGAQEAHEAIRPTYLSNQTVEGTAQEKKLYNLIWKRTIASQMSNAKLAITKIEISSPKLQNSFIATAERLIFDGFLRVYSESKEDEGDSQELATTLPQLDIGQIMDPIAIKAIERFSQKPPRYSEASLVKKLEELGIGRPSTYASTVSTLHQRGYVIKESRPGEKREFKEHTLMGNEISLKVKSQVSGAEKGKLFPEDIGILVNDFLSENFSSIVDYNFTAEIEAQFDKVAEGSLVWNQLIDKFYRPFNKLVEETLAQTKHATLERVLGKDPVSQKEVIVRMGKYGPLAQIGSADDSDKKFVSLAKGQLIETITLQEALKLFELPRVVGSYNDQEIVCAIGRYGPYLRYKGKFISLGKENDPYTINEQESIDLIEQYFERERKKVILSLPKIGVEVLNGRYGPYIKRGKDNFRIPKGIEAEGLTVEKIEEIIEKQIAKKSKK
ncbi:MAG: type I DNA topoisomerase [Bacteroidales bacterium]